MPKDSVSGNYYNDDAYKALVRDREKRASIGEKVRQKVEARKVREAAMGGGRSRRSSSSKTESKPAGKLPPSSKKLIDSLKNPLSEGYKRIRGG